MNRGAKALISRPVHRRPFRQHTGICHVHSLPPPGTTGSCLSLSHSLSLSLSNPTSNRSYFYVTSSQRSDQQGNLSKEDEKIFSSRVRWRAFIFKGNYSVAIWWLMLSRCHEVWPEGLARVWRRRRRWMKIWLDREKENRKLFRVASWWVVTQIIELNLRNSNIIRWTEFE